MTAPAIVYNNRPRLIRCFQSIRNKGPDLVDFVCDSEVDIVVITETWLKSGDSAARIAATPSGYRLFDHPRPDRNGGGLVFWLGTRLLLNKLKRVFVILLSTLSGLFSPALLVFAWLSSTGRRTLKVIRVLWVCSSQNSPSS